MAKQGRITIDVDRCKGCGLCITACPLNLLAFNNEVVNKKGYQPAYIHTPEKCIGCTNCAQMCPDVVISVEKL